MTRTVPRLLTALALCGAALPATAANTNEADLIKGIRTHALYGALPDPVGDFALIEASSDPNRHTLRARYEPQDRQAGAVVNIRAVRARGKIVELPDGNGSPAVAVNNVLKQHSQPGESADRVALDEVDGGPMNCVKVTRNDHSMVRLICRTAVHGRMIETQSDARVGDGGVEAAHARLAAFAQEAVAAVRAIDPQDK